MSSSERAAAMALSSSARRERERDRVKEGRRRVAWYDFSLLQDDASDAVVLHALAGEPRGS
jgi:hypothetical protein